jgi:predicted phosphodiesterase
MRGDPLAVPARIAFVGDLHMNAQWARRAIRHAAERGAEVIVHLGDFGYTFDAKYMRVLNRTLSETGVPLLFVDGNHECFTTLLRYPIRDNGLRQLTDWVWHLPRGFRWTWDGVRFLALGGAHSVDRPYRVPGTSWWSEETIGRGDVARVMQGGPADVLISHDCPVGVTIPGIDDRSTPAPFPPAEMQRAHEHRQLMRSTIGAVRPSMIWHGHYHVRYQTVTDLGWGPVVVNGLDCDDSTLDRNVVVVDLADLRLQASATDQSI